MNRSTPHQARLRGSTTPIRLAFPFANRGKHLTTCCLLLTLTVAAAAQPVSLRQHLVRARAALGDKKFEAAADEFQAALALDPQNAQAHEGLGIVAFDRGDCTAAAREFQSALTRDHSLIEAQWLIGICEKRDGNSAAQHSLEQALTRFKDPTLRLEVGVELADLYYQQGDLDRALPLLRTLVAAHPDNIDLLFFAQTVYTDLADDTMNKIALLAPDSARMQQLIAEHLVNSGDLKRAGEYYRKALAIDPYLPGAHFELGEVILEQSPTQDSNQNAAQKEFELALKVDGDGPRLQCKLARIAFLKSDMEAALSHYRRAYAMSPGNVEAGLGISRVFMTQNKPGEALPYLQKAVNGDPLNAEAHYRLAMAEKALQMKGESQAQLRLFQEIRKSQDRVAEIYREMNRTPPPQPGSGADLQ
jgi:tetratricopeptide (TPR) repeat protein